jgi:hypothetical protein
MREAVRAVVLIALLGLSMVSMAGTASAKSRPGSPKWCAHHPRSTRHGCTPSGGSPAPVRVTVSPNPMVETGNSDVYAVFSVGTSPVYAEQTVEIVSGLNNRCRQGVTWMTDQGTFSGSSASATADDDGNASFTFLGASCAAGTVQVIADVEAGTHPTTTTTFTIDPPAPSV